VTGSASPVPYKRTSRAPPGRLNEHDANMTVERCKRLVYQAAHGRFVVLDDVGANRNARSQPGIAQELVVQGSRRDERGFVTHQPEGG
jgi:hypothetical protein